ncbi:Nitrile-specifier protein 5 [Thelohanellus kitauei]|uniref:Rab9 effector protein with kelch motifs n=1 Tax=Thelohanellus kitauei TaxID=669202 RepID=A0A0C2MS62_THEKT|nr:Nitrile-specifier protein 5 [Thelohanellus kitauei]
MNLGKPVHEPIFLNGLCMTSVKRFLIIYGGYINMNFHFRNDLLSYDTVSGIWRRYKTLDPTADCCFFSSICSTGNLVYIFGGTDQSCSYSCTNSLLSFDLTNASWKTVSPYMSDYDENKPPPMGNSCIFYHDGSLYVLGGILDNEFVDTMYKFCLDTSTWSLVSINGLKPLLKGQIFGTVYENKYIFDN